MEKYKINNCEFDVCFELFYKKLKIHILNLINLT